LSLRIYVLLVLLLLGWLVFELDNLCSSGAAGTGLADV